MNIAEVLAQVDALKPNQYDDQMKIAWLSTLDGKIYAEVMLTHELPLVEQETFDETTGEYVFEMVPLEFNGYTEYDMNADLLVKEPYSDIYTNYIFAMIDYHNQEMDRYNNSMMMFNSRYAYFKAWYNKNHMPLSQSPKLF